MKKYTLKDLKKELFVNEKVKKAYFKEEAKLRLEKIDSHLEEKLKNKKFRKLYELECAKVSLAQKITVS